MVTHAQHLLTLEDLLQVYINSKNESELEGIAIKEIAATFDTFIIKAIARGKFVEKLFEQCRINPEQLHALEIFDTWAHTLIANAHESDGLAVARMVYCSAKEGSELKALATSLIDKICHKRLRDAVEGVDMHAMWDVRRQMICPLQIIAAEEAIDCAGDKLIDKAIEDGNSFQLIEMMRLFRPGSKQERRAAFLVAEGNA